MGERGRERDEINKGKTKQTSRGKFLNMFVFGEQSGGYTSSKQKVAAFGQNTELTKEERPQTLKEM